MEFNPESLALTRVLALAHLALSGWALWVTRYPVMTVFHGFLAVESLAFGVRPLLAAAEGGYTLYPAAGGWADYNRGLVYQLLFNGCFVAAYVWAYGAQAGRRGRVGQIGRLGRPHRPAQPAGGTAMEHPPGSPPSLAPGPLLAGYLLSVLPGVAAVAAMHLLSGGAWLPGRRAAAITAVVPYGKILFPLAVIPLSASLPLAYLAYVAHASRVLPGERQGRPGHRPDPPHTSRGRRVSLLSIGLAAGTGLAFVLLILLYQRGYLLNGLLVTIFLYDRLRGVNYAKAALAVLAVLVLLGGLRPLAGALAAAAGGFRERGGVAGVQEAAGREGGEATGQDAPGARRRAGPVKAVLLYGANFDHADVWPVALAYAAENGLLKGATLAAIPARFLTPAARKETDRRTAVDRLNEYYWKHFYWQTRFGFNVTLPQEMYLNFGAWPLPAAGALPGLLTALCDRWLWRRRRLDVAFVYAASATFAAGGFVKEPGAVLQWGLAYLLLGTGIGAVAVALAAAVPGRLARRAEGARGGEMRG